MLKKVSPGYLFVVVLTTVVVGIMLPTLIKAGPFLAYLLLSVIFLTVSRLVWVQVHYMLNLRLDYVIRRDEHVMGMMERSTAHNIAVEGPRVNQEGLFLKKYSGLEFMIQKPVEMVNAPGQVLLPAPSDIPSLIRLEDYVLPEQVTLNHLFLGLTEHKQPIYTDFREMFHVALAGTTRWGKSVLVQSLFTQFLYAIRESMEFWLVDSGGTTFCDFGLPFVDEPREAEKMFAHLMEKLIERRALFKEVKAKNLNVYNAKVGENNALPRLVVVIEEGLDLLESRKSLTKTVKRLVSWAAKYGVHIIFVSQSMKTTILDNDIRSNFSSKFQFRAEGIHQARTLIADCPANTIKDRGRCYSVVNGQPMIELQTPIVDEETMAKAGEHYMNRFSVLDTRELVSNLDPSILDLDQYTSEEPEFNYAGPEEKDVCLQYLKLRAQYESNGKKLSWRTATKEIYGEGKFGESYNTKLRKTLDRNDIAYE